MGLDFSHGNAHWSYSRFNRFRTRIFEETSKGLKLKMMEGFNHNQLGECYEKGVSFDLYNHPLRDLIDHSDCDGHLTPKQMKVIEPALRHHVNTWPDDFESNHDKTKALELCDSMIEAINKNENLEFC